MRKIAPLSLMMMSNTWALSSVRHDIPSPQPYRHSRRKFKTARVRKPAVEQAAKTAARYIRRQAAYNLCIANNPCL